MRTFTQPRRFTSLAFLGLFCVLESSVSTALAQGTDFTYQGRLTDAGNPASGIYDLRFTIYDAPGGGSILGGPLTNATTSVSNGLFTVTIDFGAGAFPGADRWLELGVRTNGAASAYQALSPRQKLTPTPYAITAANATAFGGQPPAAFAPASGSSAYVAKSGDTMTGSLNLPANGLQVGGAQLVTSDGLVAIGKANPASALDVNGTVTATGFSGPLNGSSIIAGSITSTQLASNTIIAVNIASNTITAGQLAPGAAAANLNKPLETRIPISALPISLTNAGSYILTNNLIGSTGSGIVIATNGVTLDLMGFELVGGIGVGISAGNFTNLNIRHGTVRGWTSIGIQADNTVNCVFDSLRVSHNSNSGLRAGRNCRVTACEVVNNGADGIHAGDNSLVEDCTAGNNLGIGIDMGNSSRVINSISANNGSYSINLGNAATAQGCTGAGSSSGFYVSANGCVVRNCSAIGNTNAGIWLNVGSATVFNCYAASNTYGIQVQGPGIVSDCVVENNGYAGILVGANYAVITGNTVRSNGSALSLGGIYITSSNCRIEANTAIGNSGTGISASAGSSTNNLIIHNTATGNNPNNFFLNATNHYVIATGSNLATNTNPYVNFSY